LNGNSVTLRGKVNRVERVKYTPVGTAICEFSLAVSQRYFDDESVGYFDILLLGQNAEQSSESVRIGKVT